MKKFIPLYSLLIAFTSYSYAQSVTINTDGSTAHPSAILDVKSVSKGVLFPRMTTAERNAITGTTGLLVFDTETNSFWFHTGSQWKDMGGGTAAGGWTITDSSAELNFGTNHPHARLSLRNTSYGYGTGNRDLTDQGSIVIGKSARLDASDGVNNIALGDSAMMGAIGDSNNIAIGKFANSSGERGKFNIAIGRNAVSGAHFSSQNIGIGNFTLAQLIRGGINNVAIGERSSEFLWEGVNNVTIGNQAMQFTQEAIGNTAVGALALKFNAARFASNNTAIGFESMFSNHGHGNTSLGYRAMHFANGTGNIAIGVESLFTTDAGEANDDTRFGSNNVAVGNRALYNSTRGSNNTALGAGANKTTEALDNSTAIGAGAIVNASNKVRIGNSEVTVIEGQVPFTVPSDGRYKFNVKDDVAGLPFILRLRPVTYQFDVRKFDARFNSVQAVQVSESEDQRRASEIRRTGFIAQEVDDAARSLSYDFSGVVKPANDRDHYSLSYDAFVVPLVKAVQEQQALINRLADQVRQLEEEIKTLKKGK